MNTPPVDDQKVMDEAIKVACMYLLYDKQNETTLRTAFVAIVQERHNHFHAKRKRKEDTDLDFVDCQNDVCQAALKILQESREAATEFTPLSMELIDTYKMQVERTQNVCRVSLVKKDKVEETTLQPESLKLKL